MTHEPFGYEYFDDPHGQGYRGYCRARSGDGYYLPWAAARAFCLSHRVLSAVDIGCAKGFLVVELRAAGINAVGYDVSSYALSFASGLPCYRMDIRGGLPRSGEAVFALGILLYLEESELSAVLTDLYAKTRRFFLISSYYAGEQQSVPDPLRRISRPRRWWRDQIEHAGFHFDHEGDAFDVYRT